jgi:hypothetical protein
MTNHETKLDEKIKLLEKLRVAMKEECRNANPMSLNFGHIDSVFSAVKRTLMEEENE